MHITTTQVYFFYLINSCFNLPLILVACWWPDPDLIRSITLRQTYTILVSCAGRGGNGPGESRESSDSHYLGATPNRHTHLSGPDHYRLTLCLSCAPRSPPRKCAFLTVPYKSFSLRTILLLNFSSLLLLLVEMVTIN